MIIEPVWNLFGRDKLPWEPGQSHWETSRRMRIQVNVLIGLALVPIPFPCILPGCGRSRRVEKILYLCCIPFSFLPSFFSFFCFCRFTILLFLVSVFFFP